MKTKSPLLPLANHGADIYRVAYLLALFVLSPFLQAEPEGAKSNSSDDLKTRMDALRSLNEKYKQEQQASPTINMDSPESLRTRAEQGDAEAQTKLGIYYQDGLGVPKNEIEAVKWYRLAAEKGNSDAQCLIGAMYAKGRGVSKDENEALRWYRLAAMQGVVGIQLQLGLMYGTGKGAPKDEVESAKWYRLAAEQGNAKAQFLLGLAYSSGSGALQDNVEAYKWLNLAASQDSSYSQDRDEVGKHLSSEQINEARRFSQEFKAQTVRHSEKDDSQNLQGKNTVIRSGTGFFITKSGFLVTNAHVVKGGSEFNVSTSSGMQSAKLIKLDTANDLAVLKVESAVKALSIVPSSKARLGQIVATVGFPNPDVQGFAPKLAKGEIASLSGALDDSRFFQISVPVQPGNSGGPLVDAVGNVVGVVKGKLSQKAALASSGVLAENVNYAVKSSYLLSLLESLPNVAGQLMKPSDELLAFEDMVDAVLQSVCLVIVNE